MTKGRFQLIAVTFTLTTLLYVDRIAISAAKSPVTQEFHITDTAFGWILSAFALGYALFQAPAGAIVDRYGPRLVIAGIVALWSIFTGLTGLAWGFVSLLVFRFLFGVAEAGAFPGCAAAIYRWLPPGERALAQGINLSGSRLGAAFALPVVAWLLTTLGWRMAFIVLGALGVLWAIAWYLWFRDSPAEHRAISREELEYIQARQREQQTVVTERPQPGVLWRSRNLWLLMGQYFASNFTFFFALTWMFPYLQRRFEMSALETSFLSAIPLIGGACGNWIGGSCVDFLYRRGWGAASRQRVSMIGFTLAALGLFVSLFAESPFVAVACLTIAVLGADMTTPPSWAVCIDIGQRYSGAVSGVMNMAGNLGAFVTSLAFPYLVAAFGSAKPFFIIGAALNVAAVVMWACVRANRGLK